MKPVRSALVKMAPKAPTGMSGFDEITGGGLPHARTSLLVGGPGSDKTIFSLPFFLHGAAHCKEPGIFVAFKGTSKRIVANAESFGWNFAKLPPRKLFFLNAQPLPEMVQSGDFDLRGMLAALEAKIEEMGARRIVFDAIDIVPALLPYPAAQRLEMHRLHEWLLTRKLTGLITAKAGEDGLSADGKQMFGFMQFLVDCVAVLNHNVVEGVSQRNLRIQKYRGSSFDENEAPFLIGYAGFEVAVTRRPGRHVKNGLLRVVSARTVTGIAKTYLMRAKAIAKERRAGCVVIDPLSTWSKSIGGISAHSVVERLIDWSKAEGITMVCTSQIDEMAGRTESGASLQISTLTDTWIYLDYLVRAGERNRGLSIIKFRGTAHSNQLRELILSNAGVTLTDTYSAGGEVLMSTLRWKKESAARVANEVAEAAEKLKRVRLVAEEAELEARVESLQTKLMAKQVEKALLSHATKSYEREVTRDRTQMRELRGADAPNSAAATNNLHASCETYLPGRHEIEIVDVYKEPKRALTDGIFMTPTLIKLAPSPMRKIVGRLIDTQIALRALSLKDLGP